MNTEMLFSLLLFNAISLRKFKKNTKNKRIIIFILYENYNLYAYFFLSQTSPTFVQPLLSNVIKQQGVKHS